MKPLGVLLISNARPSRSWNFANRIVREVPGAEICGVIQQPLRSIPRIQRLIAKGAIREIPASSGWRLKATSFLHSIAEKVVALLLWFLGCPNNRKAPGRFTTEDLRRECIRAGWPIVIEPESSLPCVSTLNAINLSDVRLVILLGDFATDPKLVGRASSGYIRACNHALEQHREPHESGTRVCIEHVATGSETSFTIAQVTLQAQSLDGPLGFTLKTDLITDDLLLQTTANLACGDLASTARAVQKWADRVLAPCLSQFDRGQSHVKHNGFNKKRCRSTWKLCLDTFLLCSPWIVCRNWYRRIRRRYPVLILAHHLVSDRPHRMGMPTEVFWRRVLYLQKHYRIVSLSQASELLRLGALRVPTVVLTFDDGYSDNFLSLRAVANEVGIPCTLFITTIPVETRREFQHDLTKGMTGFLPLTWDQIQYWRTRGAEFGSHTRTHFDCGSNDLENLRSEIMGSKSDLESQLGVTVNLFAFPYGKCENMSSEAMRLAASAYTHFVSSFGGETFSWKNGPQYHLFRKKFYESEWELELELQSVFDLVDKVKRRFLRHTARSTTEPAQVSLAPVPALAASVQSISSQQRSAAEAFSPTKNS